MKTALLASLLAAFVSTARAVNAPPTDVVVFEHGQVANAFAKGLPLLINSRFKILAGRRVMAGVVEIHDHDTDVIYVEEGAATFVTGGTPVDPKPTTAGETRAAAITGGVTRHLVKGDVIVIPSGIPHWFTQVDSTFLYFVVKVTK